jgi:hypothetical protein
MEKQLSGKLSIKLILFLWLCLIGLVAHIFVDNIHQIEFLGIARQISEGARVHCFYELLEHEDDCMPYVFDSSDTEKPQSIKVIASQLPVHAFTVSPILPPPKSF